MSGAQSKNWGAKPVFVVTAVIDRSSAVLARRARSWSSWRFFADFVPEASSTGRFFTMPSSIAQPEPALHIFDDPA